MKKYYEDSLSALGNWDREKDPYGLGRSLRGFKQDTDEMLGHHGIQRNPSGIPPGPALNIPAPVLIGTMVVLTLTIGITTTSPEQIQAADEKRKAEIQAQEAQRQAEEKARFAAAYAKAQADLQAAREKAAAEQAAEFVQRQGQVVVPVPNQNSGIIPAPASDPVPADVYR